MWCGVYATRNGYAQAGRVASGGTPMRQNLWKGRVPVRHAGTLFGTAGTAVVHFSKGAPALGVEQPARRVVHEALPKPELKAQRPDCPHLFRQGAYMFYDCLFSSRPTQWGAWLLGRIAESHWRRISALPRFSRMRTLFEIGPGRCDFARRCIAAGMRYTAMDPNESICQSVGEAGGEVVRAAAPPVPLGDGAFDLVYASNVLEHMPDYLRALELLAEMKRVCAEGGYVVIHVPDLLSMGLRFWDAEYSHGFPTTRRRMLQMCQDVGLDVVAAEHFSGFLGGWTGAVANVFARMFPVRLASVLCLGKVSAESWHKTSSAMVRSIFLIAEKPKGGWRGR